MSMELGLSCCMSKWENCLNMMYMKANLKRAFFSSHNLLLILDLFLLKQNSNNNRQIFLLLWNKSAQLLRSVFSDQHMKAEDVSEEIQCWLIHPLERMKSNHPGTSGLFLWRRNNLSVGIKMAGTGGEKTKGNPVQTALKYLFRL